jgi:YD repeat-containing protein
MKKHYAILLLFSFFQIAGSWSQEVQIFTVEDFDLKGKVESCLVSTDYGKELFEFNKDGVLTKTVTQYNDNDQDITYYKYNDGELVEKRMESYKNNVLDESTSMANFYEVDTIPNRKVTEKIISYDKQFLEQEQYHYDDEGKLVRIISSNGDGVDEITFEYSEIKNEHTVSTFTNGILQKSVRTSTKKGPNDTQKVVLTKEYIDGEPNTALEEVFNSMGNLVTSEDFLYDMVEKEFVSQKKRFYHYTDGFLSKVVKKTINTESADKYIFQFDSHDPSNWVKQIVAPSNTYITRTIKYYEEEAPKEETTN